MALPLLGAAAGGHQRAGHPPPRLLRQQVMPLPLPAGLHRHLRLGGGLQLPQAHVRGGHRAGEVQRAAAEGCLHQAGVQAAQEVQEASGERVREGQRRPRQGPRQDGEAERQSRPAAEADDLTLK